MSKMVKPKELAKLVGQNIAGRRKMRGLTQEALAFLVGIEQQSLSRIEKGRVAPHFERLAAFAEALQCSVPDLFRLSGSEEEPHLASIADILSPLSAESKQAAVNMLAPIARELLRLEESPRKRAALCQSKEKAIPKSGRGSGK